MVEVWTGTWAGWLSMVGAVSPPAYSEDRKWGDVRLEQVGLPEEFPLPPTPEPGISRREL